MSVRATRQPGLRLSFAIALAFLSGPHQFRGAVIAVVQKLPSNTEFAAG
jgi:hypothetical protein